MVVIQEKGTQQSLMKIILQAAAYDTVRKRTVISIEYVNKEGMAILNQNKARLENNETSISKPDSSSGIYLTTAKVLQCTLMADNMREKEEGKK